VTTVTAVSSHAQRDRQLRALRIVLGLVLLLVAAWPAGG
jgi:hypothetical protein